MSSTSRDSTAKPAARRCSIQTPQQPQLGCLYTTSAGQAAASAGPAGAPPAVHPPSSTASPAAARRRRGMRGASRRFATPRVWRAAPAAGRVPSVPGPFVGGVAALARELGHAVEGSDQAVYPPMSTQLERLGIGLKQGYLPDHICADCDTVVIGNALSRGNPAVEAVLDSGRAYTSGAEWLREQVLPGREVLAVAGTHGKTTTSTLLAFLLQAAGREPGFLIGGVAEDFGVSARLGAAGDGAGRPLFVVEADEYDTAFFDKRSKFVHYRPRIAI